MQSVTGQTLDIGENTELRELPLALETWHPDLTLAMRVFVGRLCTERRTAVRQHVQLLSLLLSRIQGMQQH